MIWLSKVNFNYTFIYKIKLYKNNEAEIGKKIRKNIFRPKTFKK